MLTYVTLDERGDEVRCCMHCDGVIAEQLRWLTARKLEAEGYEIGYRPDAKRKAPADAGRVRNMLDPQMRPARIPKH